MKKIIDGYENYSISDNGVVINEITGKVKSQFIDKKGYSIVTLFKDNKSKNLKIHRLVATAFIPNKNSLPQINHINGIKTDNRVENLEWCTSNENIKHRYYVLKNGVMRKVRCIETGEVFESERQAREKCGYNSQRIGEACRNGIKVNGLHWEYVDYEHNPKDEPTKTQIIINAFSNGNKTISEVSKETGIDRRLVGMIKKKYINEICKEITEGD